MAWQQWDALLVAGVCALLAAPADGGRHSNCAPGAGLRRCEGLRAVRLRGGSYTPVAADLGEDGPTVVRPLAPGEELPRVGPDGQAAAEEMVFVATEGAGQLDPSAFDAESLAAGAEGDYFEYESLDSEDPISRLYPPMKVLREHLDPATMTREEFYFSRDYSIQGYEPMPASRVLFEPGYDFPDTGSCGYLPDDWSITHMEPPEPLESDWKQREANSTLIPWLLQNAAACNQSSAPGPPAALGTLRVPTDEPSLRLALRQAREGSRVVELEEGDHWPTRRLVFRRCPIFDASVPLCAHAIALGRCG